MQVLQRPNWYGSPVDLGELFIVKKNGREATCKLRSHQFGWELRLFIGTQTEVVQTQVCRSQDESPHDRRTVESRDDREGLDVAWS